MTNGNPLADGAQQLATDVRLARPPVAHHAAARAHDADAHAVEHPGEVLHLAVHAPPGLALAIERVNDALAVAGVLELDADLPLLEGVLHHVVLLDVPLILQHLRDAGADLAVAHQHEAASDAIGVADAGQHVGD